MSSVHCATFLIVVCGLSLIMALDLNFYASQPDYVQAGSYQRDLDYYTQYYRSLHASQQAAAQPRIPVQPSDDTYFRDYYGESLPYRPSEYASHNYFNQPASATEENYFISPVDTNANTLEGALDSVLPESHGNHLL